MIPSAAGATATTTAWRTPRNNSSPNILKPLHAVCSGFLLGKGNQCGGGGKPLRPPPVKGRLCPSLAVNNTNPKRNRLSRQRRETGGERRTDKQKKVQVPARPREAYEGSTGMAALNHVGAGVRGGNPWAEFCHPGRSLVLSSERESTSNTKDNKPKTVQRTASSVFLRSFPAPQESTFPRLGKENVGLLCGCMEEG